MPLRIGAIYTFDTMPDNIYVCTGMVTRRIGRFLRFRHDRPVAHSVWLYDTDVREVHA